MRLEFANVSFAITSLDGCMRTLSIYLKSVHFKNPVALSPFLSKSLSYTANVLYVVFTDVSLRTKSTNNTE